MTILLVDDRDSFGRLLTGYLRQLGVTPRVVTGEEFRDLAPAAAQASGVVFASAPAGPVPLEQWAGHGVTLLGIGNGMHAIAAAFGGELQPTAEAMHGKTVAIDHDAAGVFAGLPSPMQVTCYHSFVLNGETLDERLAVTARSGSGEIMAVAHAELPVSGVQFHPESVLTEHGYQLLGNWLALAGHADAPSRGAALAPLIGL